MNTTAVAPPRSAGANEPAEAAPDLFAFVKKLAYDLGEDLELPGFPDVVVRLQKTLANKDAAVKDIVRLIKTEPALGARVLQLANSAAFNPGERAVSDLRSAVTLLGFNLLRSTATTFAMRQVAHQEWLKPLQPQLTRIWRGSVGVAATCFTTAGKVDGIQPDEAMACGLFHQLGDLYVLTRAHRSGIRLGTGDDWAGEIAGWLPTIGRSFVESWGMPAHLAEAIEGQNSLEDDDADPAALSMLVRLLAAAKVYQRVRWGGSGDTGAERERLARVKFGAQPFLDLVSTAHAEIDAVSRSMSS